MPRAYLFANANNPSACVVGCSHVCEEICAENPQMWATTQAPRSPYLAWTALFARPNSLQMEHLEATDPQLWSTFLLWAASSVQRDEGVQGQFVTHWDR
jgi:hypothetical protein